uniref:DBC1/CARP1 catalytically inactive NUDIX hydrolase domain-containing protein n=1 Tax=Lutzomyia longipalpis TaxID=7200 RepID=A0A1B0CCS2_LUTLO
MSYDGKTPACPPPPPWQRNSQAQMHLGLANQTLVTYAQNQPVYNTNIAMAQQQGQQSQNISLISQMNASQLQPSQIYSQTVSYPSSRGLNPIAFSQQPSSGQSSHSSSSAQLPLGQTASSLAKSHGVFNGIGVVTKMQGDVGFIDKEVFFNKNVCAKGSYPKVGDRVLVEVNYNSKMPFKWNATRVQVVSSSGSSSLSSHSQSRSSLPVPHKSSSYSTSSPTENGSSYSRHRSRRTPSPPRISESKSSRSRDPRLRRDESPYRSDEEERKRRREREKEKYRERKGSTPDRRERSPRRSSPPKKRRSRAIPRYMVQVPTVSLTVKEADVLMLRKRYGNLYVPSDFFFTNIKWPDAFPPNVPFSIHKPCSFHIMRKDVEPVVCGEVPPEPDDADYLFSAKVMLMGSPPIEEMYSKCITTAEEKEKDDERDVVHPSRLINFLVGVRGKNEAMAIGGPWSPSMDGENPQTDVSVLIRTAIRSCKTLTGIDLYRFVELYYRRGEVVQKGRIIPPRIETVVIFLPDVRSCIPTRSEWDALQGKYRRALDRILLQEDESPSEGDGESLATAGVDQGVVVPKAESSDAAPAESSEKVDTPVAEGAEAAAAVEAVEPAKEAEKAATEVAAAEVAVEKASEENREAVAADDGDETADDVVPENEPTHWSKLEPKAMKIQELRDELSARNISAKGTDETADDVVPENEPTHWSKLEPKAMKIQELRDELSARNISAKGTVLDDSSPEGLKAHLVTRLTKAIRIEIEAEERAEELAAQEAEEKAAKEAQEKADKEAQEKAEKEAQEKAEKEAQEKAEKEAEEKPTEEAEKAKEDDAMEATESKEDEKEVKAEEDTKTTEEIATESKEEVKESSEAKAAEESAEQHEKQEELKENNEANDITEVDESELMIVDESKGDDDDEKIVEEHEGTKVDGDEVMAEEPAKEAEEIKKDEEQTKEEEAAKKVDEAMEVDESKETVEASGEAEVKETEKPADEKEAEEKAKETEGEPANVEEKDSAKAEESKKKDEEPKKAEEPKKDKEESKKTESKAPDTENTDSVLDENDLSDLVIIDEVDTTTKGTTEKVEKPKKPEKKPLDERERQALEKKYTLPDNPQIIVHPNKLAKNGKFDCTMMSLSVLLDYRPEDTKEHTFEVSLFAELFNEMLMRDFGFNIYKALNLIPEKVKEVDVKKDEKKCEVVTIEDSPGKESVKDSPKKGTDEKAKEEVKHKDDEESVRSRKSRERTDREKSERSRIYDESDDDSVSIRSGEKRKREKDRQKYYTAHPDLLLSFVYFDQSHCGYIFEKDVEDLFYTLGLDLSRSQIRKLVAKSMSRDALHYRKLTDLVKEEKEESAADDSMKETPENLEDSLSEDVLKGNKIYLPVFKEMLKSIETSDEPPMKKIKMETSEEGEAPAEVAEAAEASTYVMMKNGGIVDVEKLVGQMQRTDKALEESEKQLIDLRKQISDLQSANSKANTKIKDLSSDLRSVSRKLNDTEQTLGTTQKRCNEYYSILSTINDRVSPVFAKAEKSHRSDSRSREPREKDRESK